MPMEHWEKENSQYQKRLAQIENWSPNLSSLIKRLPDIPLDYTPSTEGLVAINLSMFVLGCMTFTDQVVKTFLTLWRNATLTTISLPARLVYELWGAVHFAGQTLTQMQDPSKIEQALRRTQRLTIGARSEVELPWGGITDERSIHVMDFVRSLTDIYPQAGDTYAFLCESCHPSYLRLTIWSLTGRPLNNWTNKKFRETAHNLIEHTLQSVEQALKGIALDTTKTLVLALPYIEKDNQGQPRH